MRSFIIIFIFTLLLSLFLPWWSVLIPTLICGTWLFDRGLNAFFTGFAAAGAAWFFPALYIHFANNAILSTRMAEMMQVGSPWVILIITFLIGGITGGFGTLLGYLSKAAFRPASTTAPS